VGQHKNLIFVKKNSIFAKIFTMNIEEQENHFKNFTEKQKNILFKKGNDYANTDRLSNFKLAGAISQLTTSQQCLSLISTKIARLGVLLSSNNKKPNNESIRDSVIDLANYSFLLDCILHEMEKPDNQA